METTGGSVKCPYCNRTPEFMTSKEFYGTDYGSNVYVCRPCDAYVGTHGRGKTPLGTLANEETRRWRKTAHSILDPMWKGKYQTMSRGQVYGWLQATMNLSAEAAHIGKFNVQQCKELVEHVKKYRGIT